MQANLWHHKLFHFHNGINFKEKKVSGEIAFALIGLKHVQIQKPASRSTTLRAFVFLSKFAELYRYKKFETRSPWQLKRLQKWT